MVPVGLLTAPAPDRPGPRRGTGVETAGPSVEGISEQASTPRGAAELGGTLVGSALLMGGAAAVGPRAGLASRLAVQPGEEALGYGLNRATRAVAGPKWSERVAPDNEPLLMSEEFAMAHL